MLSSWAVGHIPSKGKRSQIAETVFLHKQFLTSSSKGSWCYGVCSKKWLQTARSWKIGGEMRRAIIVAVSCGSGFSVQFSMFPDALACPLRSQVGMPRLSVVIFFLLESALSFRTPETLCEALLGTCAITRQRFLSPIWHKLSVTHLPKFQALM